jgi:hypothetical protein
MIRSECAAKRVPDEDLERFQTVADTVDYVRRARVLGFDAASGVHRAGCRRRRIRL